MPEFPIAPRLLVVLFSLTCITGCGEHDKITQYNAPKEIVTKREESNSRPAAWFLKMTGPAAAVEEQFLAFGQFISRFRLDPSGTPSWDLPEGWQDVPASELDPTVASARHATLRVKDSQPPLDITVTTLPSADPTSEEYIQSNFNRWRQQLGMPPVTDAGWLSEARNSKELAFFGTRDGFVVFVNLTGKTEQFGEAKTVAAIIPFVPGGVSAPDFGGASEAPAARPMAPALKYDTPEGWSPTQKPLASIAFTVADGDEKADITVIRLGGGGGMLENVNRWRGQVGLAATTQAELKTEPVSLGDIEGQAVELVGEKQTILAVIIPQGEAQWFVKLLGPNSLAAREREHFLSFAKSLRFE